MPESRKILCFLLFISIALPAFSQADLKLARQGRYFLAPGSINGHPASFRLDTGGAYVTVSEAKAESWVKAGFVEAADVLLSDSTSTVPKGSIGYMIKHSQGGYIRIRELDFAGIKLYNANSAISHSKNAASLSVSQSLFTMLGGFTIDTAGLLMKVTNDIPSYDFNQNDFADTADTAYNSLYAAADTGSDSAETVDSGYYKNYGLIVAAFNAYNSGAVAFNNRDFKASAEYMRQVVDIWKMDSGHKFDGYPLKGNFDTVAAQAYMGLANCAYYQYKYDEALPLLLEVKNNPITKRATVYELLANIMDKKGSATALLGVIKEGRAAFPDDVVLRNQEINWYMSYGSQAEIAQKMEEAVARAPNDTLALYNLATLYSGQASPQAGKPPDNREELVEKSESAYLKLLALAPGNAAYNYNFGALYYNQGALFNTRMNEIAGYSDEEEKTREGLKAQRDMLMGKALPYLEEAYYTLLRNERSLGRDDRAVYKNSIKALSAIYPLLGDAAKGHRMKVKYDSVGY